MHACTHVSARIAAQLALGAAAAGRLFLHLRFGWHCLSNATCLIQPYSLFCLLRRVKEHHNVLHPSPLLKNVGVRQVVLDECFPLIRCRAVRGPARPRIYTQALHEVDS